MSEVHAALRQVVLDGTDIRALAEFYRGLLGWSYRPGDEPPAAGAPDPNGEDWLVLGNPDGGVGMAFQRVSELTTTTWPDQMIPQQLHLDLSVPTQEAFEEEHRRVIALGARVLFDRADDAEEPLYVYADPAGHPFCIFVAAD